MTKDEQALRQSKSPQSSAPLRLRARPKRSRSSDYRFVVLRVLRGQRDIFFTTKAPKSTKKRAAINLLDSGPPDPSGTTVSRFYPAD